MSSPQDSSPIQLITDVESRALALPPRALSHGDGSMCFYLNQQSFWRELFEPNTPARGGSSSGSASTSTITSGGTAAASTPATSIQTMLASALGLVGEGVHQNVFPLSVLEGIPTAALLTSGGGMAKGGEGPMSFSEFLSSLHPHVRSRVLDLRREERKRYGRVHCVHPKMLFMDDDVRGNDVYTYNENEDEDEDNEGRFYSQGDSGNESKGHGRQRHRNSAGNDRVTKKARVEGEVPCGGGTARTKASEGTKETLLPSSTSPSSVALLDVDAEEEEEGNEERVVGEERRKEAVLIHDEGTAMGRAERAQATEGGGSDATGNIRSSGEKSKIDSSISSTSASSTCIVVDGCEGSEEAFKGKEGKANSSNLEEGNPLRKSWGDCPSSGVEEEEEEYKGDDGFEESARVYGDGLGVGGFFGEHHIGGGDKESANESDSQNDDAERSLSTEVRARDSITNLFKIKIREQGRGGQQRSDRKGTAAANPLMVPQSVAGRRATWIAFEERTKGALESTAVALTVDSASIERILKSKADALNALANSAKVVFGVGVEGQDDAGDCYGEGRGSCFGESEREGCWHPDDDRSHNSSRPRLGGVINQQHHTSFDHDEVDEDIYRFLGLRRGGAAEEGANDRDHNDSYRYNEDYTIDDYDAMRHEQEEREERENARRRTRLAEKIKRLFDDPLASTIQGEDGEEKGEKGEKGAESDAHKYLFSSHHDGKRISGVSNKKNEKAACPTPTPLGSCSGRNRLPSLETPFFGRKVEAEGTSLPLSPLVPSLSPHKSAFTPIHQQQHQQQQQFLPFGERLKAFLNSSSEACPRQGQGQGDDNNKKKTDRRITFFDEHHGGELVTVTVAERFFPLKVAPQRRGGGGLLGGGF